MNLNNDQKGFAIKQILLGAALLKLNPKSIINLLLEYGMTLDEIQLASRDSALELLTIAQEQRLN